MTVIAPNNSQGGKRMWPSEEEKLARIKLETRLAPRHITQEQQNRIAEKLAEFKGTQVAFGVKPSTDESHWLMRWLASPFGMAGWKVEMNVNPAEMKYIHAGIMVETTKNPQAIVIANKVVEALQADQKVEAEKDKIRMDGVNVILQMQTTSEAKKALLMEEYDYSEETAEALVSPVGTLNKTLETLKSLKKLENLSF